MISFFASLVHKAGLPSLPHLKVVTTGSESLLAHQKQSIEQILKVNVFDHYGQAEGAVNISQCENGNYHIDEDFSIVEMLPLEDNNYELVGTNLTNFAFPFIRYSVGDLVTYSGKTCDCGKLGRVVDEIDGRKEDYVVLPNSVKIGRLDHIFKEMDFIKEAQIFQRNKEEIIFRIVNNGELPKEKIVKSILTEARKRLGNQIKISVKFVNAIERTKSGKLRFVVSEING